MVTIRSALRSDLPEILALQFRAYRSEGELCANPSIPPLVQTLAEVESEYVRGIVLAAESEPGHIIGSVRGFVEEGTGFIGKLIVEPSEQGRGIGSKLLSSIEEQLDASRLELFTSMWSERNLKIYQHRGYQIFKQSTLPPTETTPELTLVFLEKYRSDPRVPQDVPHAPILQ